MSTDAADVTLAKLELDKANDVLQQRQTELDQTRITAPIDGILGNLKTSVGSSVLPGDPIATVFNTARPMVVFSVPSNQARGLKPGMPVEVTSKNEADSLGKGQIIAGGPDVDPATGIINFKAQLTATNRPLAPGEFVNVRFHSGS
jgi:multidrug efflux system membrane fusion protein